ncbi:SPW repeat protein, partial [Streptomyces sp. NPDC088090]
MATESTNPTTGIDTHPDLMALRGRYEEAAAKPWAGLVEGLALLAGLYLAISPWVAGFTGFHALTVTNLILGIALAVLALGFGSVLERTHGLGWAAVVIGAFTIVAPWVVSGSPHVHKTILSNVITGAVICLVGLATMGMGMLGRSRSRSRGLPAGGGRMGSDRAERGFSSDRAMSTDRGARSDRGLGAER